MRILLTCGIGDFVAMESYLTDAEREAVRAIHWASRARPALMELVPFAFPNLDEHVVERDTWGPPFSATFCIYSRKDLPNLDPSVLDWSVKIIVDQVRSKARRYTSSSLVRRSLCDISRLQLPERYFVVHPYSENARTPVRDMTPQEWALAHSRIRSQNAVPIIVNKGGQRLERLPGTLDLTDELTLAESIEVTKRASGFIGAASLFSVVASKTLPSNRIIIKGSRDLKMNYSGFYYAPHATNSIVTVNLLRTLGERTCVLRSR